MKQGDRFVEVLWVLGALLMLNVVGTQSAEAHGLQAVWKKEKPAEPKKGRGGLSAYSEVVTDQAVTQRGFILLHRVDDAWLFEIPFAIMGRDVLVVNKVAGVTEKLNETALNKGLNYRNLLIQLHHDAERKSVLLREINPRVECRAGDAICASVEANYLESRKNSLPDGCRCKQIQRIE